MSAFGLDPEHVFRRRPRPRVVTNRRPPSRRRRIIGAVLVALVLILLLAGSTLRLRISYLFLSSLGHSNVFWTPLVTQVLLFLIGLVVTAALVGISVPFWSRALRCVDDRAGRYARWAGLALAILAGILGGAHLAGQWQDVLLFIHGHQFGAVDPVFGQDYSFFLFTLPIIDAISGILWAAALLGLLGAIAVAVFAGVVVNAPTEIDFTLTPAEGRTPDQGLRIAIVHAGLALVGVFILAALGSHFGVYHLVTDSHSQYSFVGLDATQRNVNRPILGALQAIALIFGLGTAALVFWRRRRAATGTAAALAGILVGWLILAAALQGIPGAVYTATSVNPNAASAQANSINDYLNTSRYAWGLQNQGSRPDVKVSKGFGSVVAPTLDDLASDPGTLRNVRIQDFRQLPDALAQIDRSRSYQTYPTITVDRYPDAAGNETQVMIGPREIKEGDLPNQSFVNKTFYYTHGYGITAVSVNQVGAEGKPNILAGRQPLAKVDPNAPPALYFNGNSSGDPRIYCGKETTQSVVVNTTQSEFDYPQGNSDKTNRAGAGMAGFGLSNPFDKLAASVTEFSGLDLFLTSSLQSDSQVLMHRAIQDRINTIAPFLAVDGDPYIVADTGSNHLVWIADAYVTSDRFPSSFRLDDGTSYMRNAVKAVVDARTCAITLYAVDPNEPLTASWSDIYPGLLHPLSEMPVTLKQHLRYPEDLFQNQARVYAQVHVNGAGDFFAKNDLYRLAEEFVNGNQQPSQAYYVELTPPGETKPRFVLLQTFSPGSSGSGSQANNMTAWLAAESDYLSSNHPQLTAVPLGNNANVLGPLQFDNNINTNQQISQEITLLGQRGSQVILGNVIVLPFNNHSFLYVRPLYVVATGGGGSGSFPQLRRVIVGTQDAVADGPDFASALQSLYKTQQPIPGLATPAPGASGSASPAPGGSPTPSGSASPTPTAGTGASLTSQENQILQDLLQHEANAEAAYAKGDLATAGKEQAAIKDDAQKLRALLQAGGATSPAPSP